LEAAEAAKRQAEADLHHQRTELADKEALDARRKQVEAETAELQRQKADELHQTKRAAIAAAKHDSFTGILTNCFPPNDRARGPAPKSWVLEIKSGRYISSRPEANTRRVVLRLEDDVPLSGVDSPDTLCSLFQVVVAVDAWSCGFELDSVSEGRQTIPCAAKLDVLGKASCLDEYPCRAR
jgi:hypothetical protein